MVCFCYNPDKSGQHPACHSQHGRSMAAAAWAHASCCMGPACMCPQGVPMGLTMGAMCVLCLLRLLCCAAGCLGFL